MDFTVNNIILGEITTEQIENSKNIVHDEIYSTNLINEIRKVSSQTLNKEEELLKRTHVCPVEKISNLQEHLGGLDSKKLKSLINDQFYNADVMKATMCITESVVYTQPMENGVLASNERIRNWFKDLKQIGSESVEGYAMSAQFDNATNFFIVKSPRNPKNTSSLHEYFVGAFGTNILRSIVPNYAYIFGGFECSPPIIDSDTKEVVAWCNNTDVPVFYILYENITPSISLRDYTTNASGMEWLNMYMQILYSLHIGIKHIGFTHYDLHDENVLARDIGKENFWIKYETENGVEYLLADRVATMIDFGISHVVYNNEHYGTFDRIPYGVYPNRDFGLMDAYKFLMFSMFTASNANNQDVLNVGRIIFRFFNHVESLEEALSKQRPLFYFIPLSEDYKDVTLLDLTSYIRNNIEIDFIQTEPLSDDILGCHGNSYCTSFNGTISDTGLGNTPHPDTIFELYDLSLNLTLSGKSMELEAVKSSFPYEVAMEQFLKEYENNIVKLRDRLNNMTILQLRGSPVENIFNPVTLRQYKKTISNVAEMYDIFQELATQVTAGIKIAMMYDDTPVVASLEISYNRDVIPLTDKANGILHEVMGDINYLNELKKNPSSSQYINNVTQQNRDMAWYYQGLNSFSYLLGVNE